MRLVLWDVDGTLVHAGGAGAEVFVTAVERELGRTIGAHEVKMGGKTDPQIALEILAFAELAEDEAQGRLPSVLEHYEAELAAVEERVRREGHVMAGVAELLPRLHAHADVVQSLLTGNLAVGARSTPRMCGSWATPHATSSARSRAGPGACSSPRASSPSTSSPPSRPTRCFAISVTSTRSTSCSPRDRP